jgi:hypothetical protein
LEDFKEINLSQMIQDKWAEFEPFIVPEGVRQWSIPEGRRRLGETFEAVWMKELQNLRMPSVDLKAKEVLVREGDGLMGVIHVLYCQMDNQSTNSTWIHKMVKSGFAFKMKITFSRRRRRNCLFQSPN